MAFENINFNNVIIDLTGRQYSMKKKDDEVDVPILCKLIITRARQGATLSMILFDCGIKQSQWLPFVRRNKKIREAIDDASHFHKAYGQRLLADMAKGYIQSNAILAKMMMVNFYDIKEEYEEPKTTKKGTSASSYKVTTTMTKEELVEKPTKE